MGENAHLYNFLWISLTVKIKWEKMLLCINFLWISLTVKILLKTITDRLPLPCPPPLYSPAYAYRFPP